MGLQADRILEYINIRQLSYGELSKVTGISKSALQRYATGETTKIPLDRIESISSALNVSPAYIMGWTDTPDEPLGDEGIDLYKQLDDYDKAEIRGEMKHMLKADKYKSKTIGDDIADDLTAVAKVFSSLTNTKSS